MRPLAIVTGLIAVYICGCNAKRLDFDEAVDNGTYGTYPVLTYMTEGDITSPRINWLQHNDACDDGLYTLLTPKGHSLETPGPMILDGDGELIWAQYFDNAFGGQAYGLRVQQYQGEDYLTFWLGDDSVLGHGAGAYYMLNSSYDVVYTVNAAGGLDADLHEFLITPRGTALVTVYDKRYVDLSAYKTFNATLNPDDADPDYVWDCLIQEISLHTGKLLFQWRASDHIDLSECYREIEGEGTLNHPWDFYHMNSIDKDDLGNYLVSARFSFALIYIDGITGEIIWRMGGKKNEFHDLDGESLLFGWQHDARFHDVNDFPDIYTPPPVKAGFTTRLVSLFDNGRDERQSRGLLLEITYPNTRNDAKIHTPDYAARTIKVFENPRHLQSSSQGSMQVMGGEQAKIILGYGYNPVWTEYAIDGTVLCDVHFGPQSTWETGEIQSYRVHKYAWKGMPQTPPRLEQSNDGLTLYASWNGATEIHTWIVEASIEEEDGWKEVFRVEKQGFETVMVPPIKKFRSKRYLRVVALDKHGDALPYGVSDTLDRGEVDVDLLTMAQDYSSDQFESSPIETVAGAVVLLGFMALSFHLIKRWRMWSSGRVGGSPIRWKQRFLYRRVNGDV